MYVRDEEEFGQAVREGKERIQLEGDMAAKVKKLYKINLTLWSFCLVCLGVAIIALMQVPITGGASCAVSFVVGTPAAAILGTETAVEAVMIGVAGGGIGVLKKLRRDYRIVTGTDGGMIIYKKID